VKIRRIFLALYLVVIHAALAFFAVAFFFPDIFIIRNAPIANVTVPVASTPAPTPLPVPSEFVDQVPTPSPEATLSVSSDQPPDVLMIPVKGIKRSQLVDIQATQTMPRSCRTTARRGWIDAIRLRGRMTTRFHLVQAPTLAENPQCNSDSIDRRQSGHAERRGRMRAMIQHP